MHFEQFVSREYLVGKFQTRISGEATSSRPTASFGCKTFKLLLTSVLSVDDIDIEILLLFREEVRFQTNIV